MMVLREFMMREQTASRPQMEQTITSRPQMKMAGKHPRGDLYLMAARLIPITMMLSLQSLSVQRLRLDPFLKRLRNRIRTQNVPRQQPRNETLSCGLEEETKEEMVFFILFR